MAHWEPQQEEQDARRRMTLEWNWCGDESTPTKKKVPEKREPSNQHQFCDHAFSNYSSRKLQMQIWIRQRQVWVVKHDQSGISEIFFVAANFRFGWHLSLAHYDISKKRPLPTVGRGSIFLAVFMVSVTRRWDTSMTQRQNNKFEIVTTANVYDSKTSYMPNWY